MSNGINVWTPEETAAAFARFSKAMELVREGKCSPEKEKQALQALIGDDDIVVVPKVAQTPNGRIFHVTSDVDVRTAADAINALNCHVKYGLANAPDNIPMIMQPVDCKVRRVLIPGEKDRPITMGDVWKIPNIVTPAELFFFGARFPEEQHSEPIITVWLDGRGMPFNAVISTYLISGDIQRGVAVYPSQSLNEKRFGRYYTLVRV